MSHEKALQRTINVIYEHGNLDFTKMSSVTEYYYYFAFGGIYFILIMISYRAASKTYESRFDLQTIFCWQEYQRNEHFRDRSVRVHTEK